MHARAFQTARALHAQGPFVSLKMMLDQAELEELIPVDPCRRVKPPRVEPTETRILSPDQPKQLIEAVPTGERNDADRP